VTVSSVYRLALHLLPADLRRKHGTAMETLFARELEHARARGRLHGAIVSAVGLWDVVRRGAYELARPERGTQSERNLSHSDERFNMDAPAHQPASANFGDSHMKGIDTTGPLMPPPTTRQLLGRHAVSFAIAFVVLTSLMLYVFASRQMPALSAKGASAGTLAEVLWLALPFTAAMTIPMAVFIAVLHQFSRLGADGTLAAARRMRDGVRHLVVPILAAAVGMAVLAFVVTAEIVPRSNERLAVVLRGDEADTPTDRSMTIGELRAAARKVGPSTEPVVLSRAAALEVEVQKKFALPAACLLLALAGMALAFRIPRGGMWLVFGASLVFFSAYYALLMTGETLADRLIVSPFVGMWGANALVLAVALLAVWRRRAKELVAARN